MSAAGSDWSALLDLALPVLAHVFGPPDPARSPRWTLGGGTAIMLQIGHRVSKDIDVFVPGTRLKAFTRSVNPGAAKLPGSVQWPGHYLKYELPAGEIDFLSAPLQTEPGYSWTDLNGRWVALETPEEVVVKKLRYRSATFKARDAFDLVAVAQVRPGLAAVLAVEVPDVLPRVAEALRLLAARDPDAVGRAVSPLGRFAALVPVTLERAAGIVAAAAIVAATTPSSS